MSSATPRHVKVLVIGAGISGLGCARQLLTDQTIQPEELLVLEARDRIGGRIHSSLLQNSQIEHGAAWIHSQGANPLMNFAQKIGVRYVYSLHIFIHTSPC